MAEDNSFGGGWLGSVPIAAGGANPQTFLALRPGAVKMFFLAFTLTLISTAGAFNLVVDQGQNAAGEGVDDFDITMNGVFEQINMAWDNEVDAFNLTPAQLRTVLGALNLRDLLGNFVQSGNGLSVPATGTTPRSLRAVFQIPVELNDLFEDGNMFANGSARLKDGQLQYVTGSTVTPTVVLANGSAVVGGLTVDLKPVTGAGDEGIAGNVWRAERILNLPTIHQFNSVRPIIALLDVLPVASNPAAGITLDSYKNWDANAFGEFFDQFRAGAKGAVFELPARGTPYVLPNPGSTAFDMLHRWSRGAPRLEISSGVTSVDVTQIIAIGPSSSLVESVATKIGGGGPVATAPITPRSLPPGFDIPRTLAAFMPVHVIQASMARSGSAQRVSASPNQAGNRAADNSSTRTKAAAGLFRKRG